ncbi:MAG: hypothetical protein BWX70_02504 [Verrucomicrobia bacterium ADurb.Bin070]|nr:MAG: hypothetical protein BWX70_02504 [Verrucomicrobia bacterium ADurb.Bin070]
MPSPCLVSVEAEVLLAITALTVTPPDAVPLWSATSPPAASAVSVPSPGAAPSVTAALSAGTMTPDVRKVLPAVSTMASVAVFWVSDRMRVVAEPSWIAPATPSLLMRTLAVGASRMTEEGPRAAMSAS